MRIFCFISDNAAGYLKAQKLFGGEFFEEFGLDTKEYRRVSHFLVSRDQLRSPQFQGSGNMYPVERSQKNRRLYLEGSRGNVLGAGLDIDA